MVRKRLTGLVALLLPFVFMQAHLGREKNVDDKKRSKMERAVSTLPDSAYEQVKKEDLLNDEVYIKLARDGWFPQEIYNPQIQISAESETKRSIFRKRDKTKRSKKESAQHSKSRNKSFVMTSVSAL